MKPGYNPFERYCRFGKKRGPLVGDDGEEIKKNFDFEAGEELLNELNKFEGVSEELSRNMHEEIYQAMHGPENILIVGTEGSKTITIITAPRSVVGGKGPKLLPTADKNRIVAMVSAEFIEKRATVCRDMEDQDGAQEMWEQLLENFFEKTIELVESGEVELLEIPDFIPEEGF